MALGKVRISMDEVSKTLNAITVLLDDIKRPILLKSQTDLCSKCTAFD